MTYPDFDEHWSQIRSIHSEYRLFYIILGGSSLFIVGLLIGSASNAPSNFILGVLIGVVTGLLTNLASWWILFHGIVPNLQFSNTISKTSNEITPKNRSGYKYRVKLINAGHRPMIDVELMARLRIKGIGRFRKTNSVVVYIPVEGDISYRIPRIVPAGGKSRSHIIELELNEAKVFRSSPNYPESIREKSGNRTLLLDDLLKLGEDATLEIAAFGYDEFSGTRKLFLSKRYTLSDIHEGPFRLDVADVAHHDS